MGCAGSHERARRVTDAFPAPGRLAAPLRPNFLCVSRLVRLHEPRHSGKFGNAVNVMRQFHRVVGGDKEDDNNL